VFIVILLVIVVCAAGTGLLSWIWFRWEKGPFWRVLEFFTRTRKRP
jgi:hypothetical protein